jgi:hypothetical protein
VRIAGFIIGLLGLLLSLSIFGAIVGIPLMIFGSLLMIFGGRRKTIINNVITISNDRPEIGSPHDHSRGKYIENSTIDPPTYKTSVDRDEYIENDGSKYKYKYIDKEKK